MPASCPCPPNPETEGPARPRRRLLQALGAALLGTAGAAAPGLARAALPADYQPLVVQPQAQPDGRQIFDLRPALAQARAQGRRLYVYLGASDCPFCRRYERFLSDHAAELTPHFAKEWLVVDLRSQLAFNAGRLLLRTGDQALPYADFQRALGDERARQLVYPSVWLLDSRTAKPLMQMPAGTGTFETVDEQLEILHLVQ